MYTISYLALYILNHVELCIKIATIYRKSHWILGLLKFRNLLQCVKICTFQPISEINISAQTVYLGYGMRLGCETIMNSKNHRFAIPPLPDRRDSGRPWGLEGEDRPNRNATPPPPWGLGPSAGPERGGVPRTAMDTAAAVGPEGRG